MANYIKLQNNQAGAGIVGMVSSVEEKDYWVSKNNTGHWIEVTDTVFENIKKAKVFYYFNGTSLEENKNGDGSSISAEEVTKMTSKKIEKEIVKDFITMFSKKITDTLNGHSSIPNSSEWTTLKTNLDNFNLEGQTWDADGFSDIIANNPVDYLSQKGMTIKSPLQLF